MLQHTGRGCEQRENHRRRKYQRWTLVDEGHDFDSRWLALIARLFDNASRSLLLMYDDAQSIYRREWGL